MRIIVIPNLLFQYIRLEELEDSEEKESYGRHRIDCIKCGFKMGEYIVGNLKCFKCGSELDY
jgi:hypothetical protein